MKMFLLPIAIVIGLFQKENTESNKLYWSKTRLLQWSDFKGKIPDSTVLSAAVSVHLELKYEAHKKAISIQIFCFVDKNESWNKDTSYYGLWHEQRHFDIGEVMARLMRKDIDSLSKTREKLNISSIKNILIHTLISWLRCRLDMIAKLIMQEILTSK